MLKLLRRIAFRRTRQHLDYSRQLLAETELTLGTPQFKETANANARAFFADLSETLAAQDAYEQALIDRMIERGILPEDYRTTL